MHIFFSGIGGAGIGPLALIAKEAGFEVSGSDKQASAYTEMLKLAGIDFYIGQSEEQISQRHTLHPIDWLVYSSALPKEQPNHAEIKFAQNHHIKHSKRDELLNYIIKEKRLKLIGVAGTHGKSTTTAMIIWLFKQLGSCISYSVGAKIPFGPMGQYMAASEYFVYECDEFDRNFLSFKPYLSLITGIGYDHHEIFPTREIYQNAFREFIGQSQHTLIWEEEEDLLRLPITDKIIVITPNDLAVSQIKLAGLENRLNAWQAVDAVHLITDEPVAKLVEHINKFPGLKQRMERLAPNLYTNYAHTPEKILAGMHAASEIAGPKKDIVVIYEPLTNRRQYHIRDEYDGCFEGAKKIYWVPTYLAREDPKQPILTPEQLIKHLPDPRLAEPAAVDDSLIKIIRKHLEAGDMVVAMDASGAGSLDDWLRQKLSKIIAK